MMRLTRVVFPAPVGPTIAIVCPGSATSDRFSIKGWSARYRNDTSSNSTRPCRLVGRAGRTGSAICSSASSKSKTRSADATPDWSRFAMDATWVKGWVNCLEYWMNACTSPRLMTPVATRTPPMTPMATDLFDFALTPEHLHQLVPGVGLLDVAVQGTRVGPLRRKHLLRTLRDLGGDDDGHWDGDERDHSQQRRDHEHHHYDADHREHPGQELADRLLQGHRHVVDVVGDAAEKLPARLAVEELQGQASQLVLNVRAKQKHRPLHHVVEQVALGPAEQRRGHVEPQRQQQDTPQGIEIDALARNHVHPRE